MSSIDMNFQQLLERQFATGINEAVDMQIQVKNGVTVVNYMNAVPPFAEIWLERLYENIFSSLAHFRVYDEISGIHTYIACKERQVLAVLLYRIAGTQVRILNEGGRFPAAEIDRFAKYVFKSFPFIKALSFHAVSLEGRTKGFPLQRFNCLEDIVLRLPASVDDYMAGLGKATRNYLHRYQNKLKRDFPNLCHVTYSRHEIEESHIRQILDLNRSRMEGKGKLTPWTEHDRRRIVELARICGMVSVIEIEGRICAGTINYCVNGNYFLEVIAHAPEYNNYRLGTVCCFATIGKCIEQGGKEYHFLWGHSEYKYRLGGVQQDLEHVSIFRSRIAMLMNADLVLENFYRCRARRMHLWVKELRHREDAMGKRLARLIHFLDAIRLGWKRQKHQWLESHQGAPTR